jgi:hypothetical protein
MEIEDWTNIAASTAPDADNVRRADPKHPLDFFNGRDFTGHFVFSLKADTGCRDLPGPPNLNGIEVSLQRCAPDSARLLLTLRDREQFDIFKVLCGHLLRATEGLACGANSKGLHLVLRRLADWHAMLRCGRNGLLSNPERIGLAGELLFLRDVIIPHLPPVDAIASWRGAHGDEQDFAVGQTQFEIKTQLSTSDQHLKISSEAQLDTGESTLFLCHQGIARSPTTAHSFTLNSLVHDLASAFARSGFSAADLFDVAITALGYGYQDDYDEPTWVLTDRRLFEIRDGFPRITPNMLPVGVMKVSYEILLRECEPFSADLAQVIDQVFA